MPDATFPFPGGKSRFASWILDHVPDHDCFVEVFGGAAGVLVNKDPDASAVEVYNDADGDLVHFFEVLREQPDELVEWLEAVPYSRHLHNQWATHYFGGYRPVDDVMRAGRFFYLRYAQWGGRTTVSRDSPPAKPVAARSPTATKSSAWRHSPTNSARSSSSTSAGTTSRRSPTAPAWTRNGTWPRRP